MQSQLTNSPSTRASGGNSKEINWLAVEQWRDALRSGQYKQTTMNLRKGNEYCCLGVFCEAVVGIKPTTFSVTDIRKYAGSTNYLPRRAMKHLNVDERTPRLFGGSAVFLNDVVNLSFDEIADLLDIALIERGGIE